MGLSHQAVKRVCSRGQQALHLMNDGEILFTTDGVETSRQRRAAEEAAAVGGLRNPSDSLKHMPNARVGGARIAEILDECVNQGGQDRLG